MKSNFKFQKQKPKVIHLDKAVEKGRITFPRTDLDPWKPAERNTTRLMLLGDSSVIIKWMNGVYKGASDIFVVERIRRLQD